ncbi:MAG TPA: hypothetical protein VGX46_11000 [Vicinamibacterales bacterium]|nr:hypothetical protein [Vicinamibacterales bacterium]
MSQRLGSLLFTALIAVFPARVALAAVPAEDVPVPGGSTALARALGIDPAPDRGRFLYEITRLIHDNPEGRRPVTELFLQSLRQPAGRGKRAVRPAPDRAATDLVPVPLGVDVWSEAVFHRRVARDELVTAIIADRLASLLCHGLASLDDQTLQFFGDHPALVTKIYERLAPTFAAFSGSLRVRANRVVPPSDRDDVVAMWEAVVGEKVTRPDRFIQQLLEMNEGRVALLYDTIGQLDAPRRAFALGLWMPSAAARADRFKALATSGTGAFREWHVRTMPFNRASYDLAMTLGRIEVEANGAPTAPASRGFWSRLFSSVDLPDDAARQVRGMDEDPIDAAWLAEAIGSGDVRQRAERLEQMAFGQRVFGDLAAAGRDRADVFVALRAVSRYRMLIVTLDRIGIRAPSVYVAAVRHAARLSTLDSHRGFVAQAQFQGALAVLSRMVRVRTLSVAKAQTLLEKLAALTVGEDGRYAGAVAGWFRNDLGGALPLADTVEAAILRGMSGPDSVGRAPRLTWEGQPYRLDLAAAELRRLQQVRDRQEGLPLDIALDVAAIGRTLGGERLSMDDAQRMATRLGRLAEGTPRRLNRGSEEENVPPGISPPPNAHETLQKVVDELTKALRNRDMKRAARESESLNELADELLAQALLSIAYAADVGDPEGTVLLAADVSHRHDFGFGAKDAEFRIRQSWALPHQEVTPGVPWRVTGSLLGLDVALAPLALRRLNFERVLEAPKLTTNQREAFALSVALLNPYDLRDEDRDRIADAIDRGTRRARAVLSESAMDALADEITMEPWRRRAIRWTFAHEPDRVTSMLSLTEVLVLGGGKPAELDPWGMVAVTSSGCLCSRLPRAGSWPALVGRPQLGLTAVGVADLHLHVAVMLKEMRLPAALARVILSGAVQDFIDEVKPTDDGDWLTLVRQARTMPRDRVEDYVAVATASGPLVPDSDQD